MATKNRRKLNTKKASVSATPWNDGAVDLAKRGDPDLRKCTAQEFATWIALQTAAIVRHASNEIRFVAELCIRDWESSLLLASNAGQPVHSAIVAFGMHETLNHARVRAGDVGHMLLAAKEGRATIRTVNGERALVCDDIPPVYLTTVAKAVLYAREGVPAENLKWEQFRSFQAKNPSDQSPKHALHTVLGHVQYLHNIATTWIRRHPDKPRSDYDRQHSHVTFAEIGTVWAAAEWYEFVQECSRCWTDLESAIPIVRESPAMPNERTLPRDTRWGTRAARCLEEVRSAVAELTGVERLASSAFPESAKRNITFGDYAAKASMTEVAAGCVEFIKNLQLLRTALLGLENEPVESIYLTTIQVRGATKGKIGSKQLQKAHGKGRLIKRLATNGKRNVGWELQSLKDRWRQYASEFDAQAGIR
jgi:hypothetical protein